MTISLKIYDKLSDAKNEWERIVPENHHLICCDLMAIEGSNAPDMKFHYVSIYKDNVLSGVMYLQHLTFSQKHFNRNLIQNKILKFASPILNQMKAHLLICGNMFRVNFQGFYFKDKNDRIDIFDCLNIYRKQVKQEVNYCGILVKDCNREFEPTKISCFQFSPFHQDLTMEMAIQPTWHTFDEYVAALSKKYRQRAIKIRKSNAAIERKYLSLEDIKFFQNDIHKLYMNVVNKQSLALGILGSDYFIQMKEQLKDNFEVVAFMKDGQLLAFSGHIYYPAKKAMELHYIGFDYTENPIYNLYFNIIFDGIETAITKGYVNLEMGRTAREAKASAGAKAVENFNYIWVKAGLPRLAVSFLSSKFQDKMGDEWQNRNPFKEIVPATSQITEHS
ncbi:MAG: hypothetical protein PSX81_11310 [bacterium]|nr:hypothetical protein [bacterium]